VALVQCLRRWQRFVKQRREKKERKRRLLERLATAIEYHEQTLKTKALLSFIKFKVMSETARINTDMVRN